MTMAFRRRRILTLARCATCQQTGLLQNIRLRMVTAFSTEREAFKSLALEVGEADSANAVLERIVSGLASQDGVALARVRLAMPGDICESCLMSSECRDRLRCLHLAASAGKPSDPADDWSRTTGEFRRVPLGARKVGYIGSTGEPILIRDHVAESPWIARPEWAEREGIASFAGRPLIFRGEILGVLGVFS